MSPSPDPKQPSASPKPAEMHPPQPPQPPPDQQQHNMGPLPPPGLQYPPPPGHIFGGPMPQGIPTEGPATHPDGPPRDYSRFGPPPPHMPFPPHLPPPPHMQPSSSAGPSQMSPPPGMPGGPPMHQPPPGSNQHAKRSPKSSSDLFLAPNAAELYNHAQGMGMSQPVPGPDGAMSGPGANHYPSAGNGVPRLPPILQVEKQQVTTSATQIASASRRRNEAHFQCPVPGCGSTFTRRFNLRGHLRSHTEERPYVCEWPGCKKGFARQHDCKRHQALHTAKAQTNICLGCKKTFSRLDALNRHLRSDGGAECRPHNPKFAQMAADDERLRQAQAVAAANALAQAAAHAEQVQQHEQAQAQQQHMMGGPPPPHQGMPPQMLPPPHPGMPPMPGPASMEPNPIPASQ